MNDPGSSSRVAVLGGGLTGLTAAWHLRSDGSWRRVHIGPDGDRLADLQELLIARVRRMGRTPVIPASPPRGLVAVPDAGMAESDAASRQG